MTSNLVSRYAVIFVVLALAGVIISTNDINFGIDLRGGTILTYKVQPVEGSSKEAFTSEDVDDTIAVISQRINKEGVKDIQVRREGEDRIVITLPNFTKEQADEIRRRMTQVGELLLAIKAEAGDKVEYVDENGDQKTVLFNLTEFEKERTTALKEGKPYTPPKGFRWFPKRPERRDKESDSSYQKRVQEYEQLKKEKLWEVPGEWMYFAPEYWDPEYCYDPENPGFTGRDIYDATRSVDDNGGRAVSFKIQTARQTPFSIYTGNYVGRQMALILNGELWSSATIRQRLSDNVQISRGGGGYTKTEQDWLLNCLQAGSLKLRPILESQDEVGATLGAKAVRRGEIAFIVGSLLVILFMLLYYRAAGIVAILAMVVNFVMIFAILMLLQASLTLPGIAGLVLTVGMAVDANILIFERIREELDKGKKLVHAAKNGFDRAFVTIFDANLTTFIVAAFLVRYGTGPVKGFGYTMMTGIICTMFAGLYVSRTLLGTAIAKGWVTELRMLRLFKKPNFDFFKKSKVYVTASLLLMVFGVVMFIATGREKYGLDFNGGTSVRLAFSEPVQVADIEEPILAVKDDKGQPRFKDIQASLVDPEGDRALLVDLKLDWEAAPPPKDSDEGYDPYQPIQDELTRLFGDKLVPSPLTDVTYDSEKRTWSATIHLAKPLGDKQALLDVMADAGFRSPDAQSVDEQGLTWRVQGGVDVGEDVARSTLLAKLAENSNIAVSTPFPKLRFLGPNVVADLKKSAIQAMLMSLIFILAYIWFRFKELKYGFAATIALVHDVLIALGVVVFVNEFNLVTVPITLNVIAGFLTIIGYSLNDTIVVFDRIRENLGNVKGSFRDIINRSINQTLSRTVLTSLTTFLVVAVIFFASLGLESPLEGLAFTLMIGVVVGTYSSIFVASPILVWLTQMEEKRKGSSGTKKSVAKKGDTAPTAG